ncbi:hypothetical protein [Bacillus marinisedimentorum]|uniref:hypothetical protein n=1 Tax=Bacillus marinisedimentorum TaxID=1821260 RepID=UPI0007E1B55D|nr:hypothetical protein [Bacillus marinisedimentorum]
MWACRQHVKEALSVLDIPHISKAPEGISCSFCTEPADVNMYYAHKPSKGKRQMQSVYIKKQPSKKESGRALEAGSW